MAQYVWSSIQGGNIFQNKSFTFHQVLLKWDISTFQQIFVREFERTFSLRDSTTPPLVCSFEYFVAKQFTFLCIFNIWLFPHFGNNVLLVPVRKVTNCRYAANLDFADSSSKRRRGALFFCWRRRGTVGAAWKELNKIFGNLDPRPKLWHLKGGGGFSATEDEVTIWRRQLSY